MMLTGLGIALGAALVGGGYAAVCLKAQPPKPREIPPNTCTDCRGNLRRGLPARGACEWCARLVDWDLVQHYGYRADVRQAFYRLDRRKLRAITSRCGAPRIDWPAWKEKHPSG